MKYIITFVIGEFVGFFGMCLIAASGKNNTREEAYEQGKRDAINNMSSKS